MAAQLAHESSSILEGTENSRNRCIRIVLDPVQDSIGEDRIEFVLKHERTGVRYSGIEAALTGGSDHVWRIVDANHSRPQGDQFFREYAVAAAQIEDALAGLGAEQVQHGLTERRHEVSIVGIAGRTPLLGWD
jgi:hypothetical protein